MLGKYMPTVIIFGKNFVPFLTYMYPRWALIFWLYSQHHGLCCFTKLCLTELNKSSKVVLVESSLLDCYIAVCYCAKKVAYTCPLFSHFSVIYKTAQLYLLTTVVFFYLGIGCTTYKNRGARCISSKATFQHYMGSGFYKLEKDFALMRWCFTYSTALIESYGVESQTNTLTVTLLRVTMWICFCLLSAGWLPTLQNIIKKQTVWSPCINCFNQLKTSSETRRTRLMLERAHFPLQI